VTDPQGYADFMLNYGCYTFWVNAFTTEGDSSIPFSSGVRMTCFGAKSGITGTSVVLVPVLPDVPELDGQPDYTKTQIRVVLQWGPERKTDDDENTFAVRDLDLESKFLVSSGQCNLGPALAWCGVEGVAEATYDSDSQAWEQGGESVTVHNLKTTVYHFYVNQFTAQVDPESTLLPPLPLHKSGAFVQVFFSGIDYPVATYSIGPTDSLGNYAPEESVVWSVFCLDGLSTSSNPMDWLIQTNRFAPGRWKQAMQSCNPTEEFWDDHATPHAPVQN